MKPTIEQLNDHKWWDENAPEGATHYDPNSTGPWMKRNGSGHWYWYTPVLKKWEFIRVGALCELGSDPKQFIERPTVEPESEVYDYDTVPSDIIDNIADLDIGDVPVPERLEDEAAGPISTAAPGYERLARVLDRALDQASRGKGKERHAQDLPFNQQPMQQLIRLYGQGFALGQAAKKAQESMRLPKDRAVAELLGAINYLAGAVIALENEDHKCKADSEA